MNNELSVTNPFLEIENPRPLGPGSFEMALSLVDSTKIKKGLRVLEIGAGSGQVAATLAKYWDVTVVAVEPGKVGRIRTHADLLGVGHQVLPLRAKAQELPFGKDAFDAVSSIGTLEMLGVDRSQALGEMIRVARPGAYIGIAEPMSLLEDLPYSIDDNLMMHDFKECFRTLDWNSRLFEEHGLKVTEKKYFSEGYLWWQQYRDQLRVSKKERIFITFDSGRWLSLGMVVGLKKPEVQEDTAKPKQVSFKDLDVHTIVKSLRENHIMEPDIKVMNKMRGTTDGVVYTIAINEEPKYVLKFDHSRRIAPVKLLYQTYSQSRLLPKLLYHDSSNAFIVYTFISGTTRYNRGLKKNWLARLVKELLNHYSVSHDSDVWGGIDRPCASWREFLECSLKDARRNLEGRLNDPRINIEGALPTEDFNAVQSLIGRISEVDDKYLLHGDTGVHNFVFHDNELAGVIDPGPTIGPITYDFVYAFCSSPDDLTLETLYDAFELLNNNKMEKSRLVDEVIFQLFCQISVCSRVHPHDLQDYLKAWEYWKVHLYGHTLNS